MKTSRILKIFMVAAAALSLASCNKFEDPYTTKGKSFLPDPSNIVVDADYKQATITWDAVPGADQYYYELRNASNFVSAKGYIKTNSFYIGALNQLTNYSFAVKAIPSADEAGKVAGSKLVKTQFQTEDASAYLWEAKAKVMVGGEDTGRTATIMYEFASKQYTIKGWFGYEGYNMVIDIFENEDGETSWCWETTDSADKPHGNPNSETNCFYWADYPANAYCFYDGHSSGAGYTWFYDPYCEYYGCSKESGKLLCWGWINNTTWTSWSIEW